MKLTIFLQSLATVIILALAGCQYDEAMYQAHSAADLANQAADDAADCGDAVIPLREAAYAAAIEANKAAEDHRRKVPGLKLEIARAEGKLNIAKDKADEAHSNTVRMWTEMENNKERDDELRKADAAYDALDRQEFELGEAIIRAGLDAAANASNKLLASFHAARAAKLKSDLSAVKAEKDKLKASHEKNVNAYKARQSARKKAYNQAKDDEKAAKDKVTEAEAELKKAEADARAAGADVYAKAAAAEAAAQALAKACPAVNRKHPVPPPGSHSPGQDIFQQTKQQHQEPTGFE